MLKPIRPESGKAMTGTHISVEDGPESLILCLRGDWRDGSGLPDSAFVENLLHKARPNALIRVSGREITGWSSVLPAFLSALRAECAAVNLRLRLEHLPEGVHALLELSSRRSPARPVTLERRKPLMAINSRRVGPWQAVVNIAGAVGEVVLGLFAAFQTSGKMRGQDFRRQLLEVGAQALAIVSLVSFLVGAILGFVGLVQLKMFGVSIYVADLVGIAMAREMAAIMTAIIIAGRTGAAFAANLATMQANEEIDALKTLAVSPVEHLIVPRVSALILMMPVLYIYACAVGIIGGMVIAIASSDITVLAYLDETRQAVAAKQFIIGGMKSVVFGALVGIVGCYTGLRAGRSAAEVGRAATSAVVSCIVGVIALDAIFALCANALRV